MGTFGAPSSYNNTGALGSATNPTTAQGLSRDRENQKAILELPGTQAWVEKTITDGVIIPTSAEIVVLPEGGASTDSLTTIALTSDGTTTLHEGMPIRLKAANSNTITVVHGTGTNNISTIDGNNVVLDTTWYLELKLIGGVWVQQETSAYKAATEAKIMADTAATPATTTARGIGRVATSADLVDGATIANGPAFLAAGVHASVASAAGKIPVANSSGKIDGWVSSDANKANVALDNLSTTGKSKLFGVDQSWQDVTSSRALNVTYQNSSNRPILVSISYYYNASAGELTFYINGNVHSRITGNRTYYGEPQFTEVTIPPGATYKIVISGTPGAITSWREYA